MAWESFSRIDLEALATPQIWERGQAYYQEGHLRKACQLGLLLAGRLAGTGGDYLAKLWFDGSELHWECNCAYPGFCKHLVALGLGWMQTPSSFFDLRPHLEAALKQPQELAGLVQRLIERDPLHFLDLIPQTAPEPEVITNRGIINFIRNVFDRPYLTVREVGNLWDQVKRIHELLATRLRGGDAAALIPLDELSLALLNGAKGNHGQIYQECFLDLLSLLPELIARFSSVELGPVWQRLLAGYFDPALWELNEPLRRALSQLHPIDPQLIPNYLEEQILIQQPSTIQLIAGYELAQAIPSLIQTNPLCYQELTRALSSDSTGSLWLCDRLAETDPEASLHLAKEGLRGADTEVKRAYRERLITLHQQRQEFKQAAAFSFMQLQEQPSFDEYLRLKSLLRQHPTEFEGYLQRLQSYLTEQGQTRFLLQIAIDRGDLQTATAYLNGIQVEPEILLAAAELFRQGAPADLLPVYPNLIEALLRERLAPLLAGRPTEFNHL